ncbi:MAG: choice-of-anchor Q domain-containing protein, partial [Planctomycetota bacterium]
MTKLTKSRAAVRPSNLLATVTAIVVVVGVFSSAQATTIYVDDDNCPGPGDGSEGNPYCSIQTAIDNAVDTDEIVVAPGTYDEAINFMGKAVWLHSSDGPDVTIIFGGVTCDSGEGSESVLQGLTVTGGYGGGMRNIGTSPSVINCRFEDNGSFDDGGGMFNSGANPTIVDSTFARNAAWGPWKTPGGNGGGMYNVDSNPVIVNCLFEENHASYGGDGGGGGGGDGGGNSSPTVTNCIFWANGIAGSSGSSVVTYSIVQGGYPGTGNINVDPMFVDPDNGDFGLLPGSPCIDAGDNTAVPEGITTDLDGNPRFVDDPGLCDFGHTDGDNPVVDIGAFEFQGV